MGSTSNILDFISKSVDAALAREPADETALARKRADETALSFVLGTESGMITSVARRVQAQLRAARDRGGPVLAVEIVFPVASEAIAATQDPLLPIVPGVAAGEGCTTAGGCASCPYMKMNSLDALFGLLTALDGGDRADGDDRARLARFSPKVYRDTASGASVAELGARSITRMRELSQHGRLPAELVAEICDARS